jgi:hypothetical protein
MFLKIEGSSSATIMDEASAEKKSTVKFTSLHSNLDNGAKSSQSGFK